MRGRLFIFEGPDLSGKDTLVRGILNCYEHDGLRVFDLKEFWKLHKRDPTMEEILDFDPHIVFFCEPSYFDAGYKLRFDLLRNGTTARACTIAEHFAQDRMRIFANLVGPLRDKGVDCIGGRNWLSSFFYQTLQAQMRNEELSIADVKSIEGNVFCMQPHHLPTKIVLVSAPLPSLFERRDARRHKQDDAETEQDDFLAAIHINYARDAPNICQELNIPYERVELDGPLEETFSLARRYYEMMKK